MRQRAVAAWGSIVIAAASTPAFAQSTPNPKRIQALDAGANNPTTGTTGFAPKSATTKGSAAAGTTPATAATLAGAGLPGTAFSVATVPSNAIGTTSADARTQANAVDLAKEQADTWYIFFGARYRGNLLPQFLLNLVVSEGTTVYSSTLGIEAEFRKNGFSIIPALNFTEFGMDETLFLEKGKPEAIAGNWSRISSSLKALSGSVDFLWSKRLHRRLELEYGFGVGVLAMFGDLGVNWVYEDPKGAYTSSSGRTFSACQIGDETRSDRTGCSTRDHSFSKASRVGNYNEASWFNGGTKPSFLPQISVPIGLRYKPSESFAGRLQVGLSLTGFWFGLSGSYGLPGRKSSPKSDSNSEAIEVEETVE